MQTWGDKDDRTKAEYWGIGLNIFILGVGLLVSVLLGS